MIRIQYMHMPTNQLHYQNTKYDTSVKLMIDRMFNAKSITRGEFLKRS